MLAHAAVRSAALLLCTAPHAQRSTHPIAATTEELKAMTLADIRGTPPLELEELVEELEAEAANALDATGAADVELSKLLAVAHTCTGDHEVAAPHATTAIDIGGPDAEMHFVLGVAAERRDAQDDALEQYEAALAVDPSFWRALFHTGKIALSFGWPADAVDYFQQVAAINPSHAPTQAFLAKLEEAGISVDEWQEENKAAKDKESEESGDSGGEAVDVPVIEIPDLPDFGKL